MPLFRRRSAPSGSAPEAIDAAQAALDDGEPREALRWADRAVILARRDGAPDLVGEGHVLRAASLVDQERFADAERAAAEACRLLPESADAWSERAVAAYRLGWFEDAATHAERALDIDPDDAAGWHLLGRALVWQERRREGDEALRRAAELDPESYVKPVRIAAAEFDRIAASVWREIPSRFRERMGNTMVVAEELPDPDEVAEGFDPDTLGVYEGATALHDDAPERIVLFQRNHETVCGTLGTLIEEVRRTLLHEVGHHFGMEEHDLPY